MAIIKEYQEFLNPEEVISFEKAIDLLKKNASKETLAENTSVTNSLIKLHLESDILITAVLKNIDVDTIEFGEVICKMLDSARELNDFKVTNMEENKFEDYRNMLIMVAKDYRVIIIELVERVYNMKLYKDQQSVEAKLYARDSINIFAPIAHRLGMGEIKTQLENLSLYILNQEEYLDIQNQLQKTKESRDHTVNKMIEGLNYLIQDSEIDALILGRSKSIYSIYKKTSKNDKKVDDLFDLLAVRIICETINECYTILGLVHNYFSPIQGRFKDYIAVKKPNLYQSIHTTVIGIDNQVFEIQIRTHEMDKLAESGLAAHWKYKEGSKNSQQDIEEQLHQFRELINHDVKDEEQLSELQEQIFESSIYALTPNKKIITLPKDATVIDFAYRIHSKIAEEMIGALVNGVGVPYETKLENGDVVELKTKKGMNAPNDEWLKFIKTKHAERKIKEHLRSKTEQFNIIEIEKGKEIISNLIKKEVLNFDFHDEKNKTKLLKGLNIKRINDFYIAVGQKTITSIEMNKIFEVKKEEVKIKVETTNITDESIIIVKGAKGIKKEIAQCCNPIYGDEIVGIIVNGVGIKIHRLICNNVRSDSKIIVATWNNTIENNNKYSVHVNIFSSDRDNLLQDIVLSLGKSNAGIQDITSNLTNEYVKFTVKLLIRDVEHLLQVTENLVKVKDVVNVERLLK